MLEKLEEKEGRDVLDILEEREELNLNSLELTENYPLT